MYDVERGNEVLCEYPKEDPRFKLSNEKDPESIEAFLKGLGWGVPLLITTSSPNGVPQFFTFEQYEGDGYFSAVQYCQTADRHYYPDQKQYSTYQHVRRFRFDCCTVEKIPGSVARPLIDSISDKTVKAVQIVVVDF